MAQPAPHPVPALPPPAPQANTEAIAFGWRAHAAQEAWTAKVDVKASIVLALDGAVLAAIIGGHNKDGVFDELIGWRNVLQGIAAGFVIVGLVLAGLVVRPSMGSSRAHKAHYRDHLIYFGHLRHWKGRTTDLAARLRAWTSEDETEQLSEQLFNMSQRNWWKHRLLQFALYASGTAALCLSLAVLWPH